MQKLRGIVRRRPHESVLLNFVGDMPLLDQGIIYAHDGDGFAPKISFSGEKYQVEKMKQVDNTWFNFASFDRSDFEKGDFIHAECTFNLPAFYGIFTLGVFDGGHLLFTINTKSSKAHFDMALPSDVDLNFKFKGDAQGLGFLNNALLVVRNAHFCG